MLTKPADPAIIASSVALKRQTEERPRSSRRGSPDCGWLRYAPRRGVQLQMLDAKEMSNLIGSGDFCLSLRHAGLPIEETGAPTPVASGAVFDWRRAAETSSHTRERPLADNRHPARLGFADHLRFPRDDGWAHGQPIRCAVYLPTATALGMINSCCSQPSRSGACVPVEY